MSSLNGSRESAAGFVLDIACVRKYPQGELVDKAKAHASQCSLMGHCIESGYALVREDGSMTLLDAAATPLLVRILTDSAKATGVAAEVTRELRDGDMQTIAAREI